MSDVEVTPTELVVSSFPARRSYSWSGCGKFKIWRPVWGIIAIVFDHTDHVGTERERRSHHLMGGSCTIPRAISPSESHLA